MTRFARFGQRNKVPQESSSWSELKTGGQQESSGANRDNKSNDETDSSLRKIKDKTSFKADNKTKQFGPKKVGKFGECYNCKERGHRAADCPKPSDGKHLEFQCFYCKEMGHKAFQCPKSKNGPRDGASSFRPGDQKGINWKEKRSDMRRVKRQDDVQSKIVSEKSGNDVNLLLKV